MDFVLSYNNNEGVLVFPVVPNDGIHLSRSQSNETFDGVNHELQSLGTMDLAGFDLSSIFPLHAYPWIRPGSSTDGWGYVHTIEAVRERRIPFRAIYLDNNGEEIFNLPVSVDKFEYGVDQAGDIAYTMEFREYRFAETEVTEIPVLGSPTGEPTTPGSSVSSGGTVGGTLGGEVLTDSQAAQLDGGGYTKRYTQNDAIMMARVMFLEARGVKSKTEIACIGWTILNRVDAGYGSISKVITAPAQFAYSASARTTSDYGYDLVALATDVLDRWSREKAGQSNVGRVLPKNYLWYAGDGKHNYFRNAYKNGRRWDYSLPSPYGS